MSRRAWLTGSSPATGDFICRRLRVPNDLALLMAVNGALLQLTMPENWETFGPLPAPEAAALMSEMYEDYVVSDWMIGAIVPYVTSTPPAGCLPCDGSTFQRADWPRLYALLDPSLISGPDTFTTPDLRGLFVLGATDDPSYPVLASGGAAAHQLTSAEMPAHAHSAQPHAHTAQPHAHSETIAVSTLINGGIEAPASAAIPAPGVTGVATVTIDPAGVTIDPVGGDQAHNNMPPYVALRYCVVAR